MEDLDWYISQAGDDIHLIEKFEAEDSYDLYEALELDELAAPGAPPVVKGSKKLDVSSCRTAVCFACMVHLPCRAMTCRNHSSPTRVSLILQGKSATGPLIVYRGCVSSAAATSEEISDSSLAC